MATRFQLVIDCADPEPLAHFWAAALGYVLEPPPDGFPSWDAYRRDLGVPEEELGAGADCIVDPSGQGPRIWFQVVPERKAIKNRWHIDIGVGGGRDVPIETRRQRVDAEAARLDGSGCRPRPPPRGGGPRPLRGRDEGSRGQRVRHQLTGDQDGRETPVVWSAGPSKSTDTRSVGNASSCRACRVSARSSAGSVGGGKNDRGQRCRRSTTLTSAATTVSCAPMNSHHNKPITTANVP